MCASQAGSGNYDNMSVLLKLSSTVRCLHISIESIPAEQKKSKSTITYNNHIFSGGVHSLSPPYHVTPKSKKKQNPGSGYVSSAFTAMRSSPVSLSSLPWMHSHWSNITSNIQHHSCQWRSNIKYPCWATGIISFQLHVSFSDPMLDGSACSLHHFR